jgi:hypothetical protein
MQEPLGHHRQHRGASPWCGNFEGYQGVEKEECRSTCRDHSPCRIFPARSLPCQHGCQSLVEPSQGPQNQGICLLPRPMPPLLGDVQEDQSDYCQLDCQCPLHRFPSQRVWCFHQQQRHHPCPHNGPPPLYLLFIVLLDTATADTLLMLLHVIDHLLNEETRQTLLANVPTSSSGNMALAAVAKTCTPLEHITCFCCGYKGHYQLNCSVPATAESATTMLAFSTTESTFCV